MAVQFRDAPATNASARVGVLLVNLGTPTAPTAAAVRRYLAEFLHDYRVVDLTRWLWCPVLHGIILPLRSRKVAHNYASIWLAEGSPLMVHSLRLRDQLKQSLPQLDVRLAMRYGEPAVGRVLQQMDIDGCTQMIVLPMYPQYSAATTASVHDAVMNELRRWRRMPGLRLINDYHLDENWLAALEHSVRSHWQQYGQAQRLMISFHGIPQRYARAGDPYPVQCEAGAQALAQRLGLNSEQWLMTYQSRFGREPWLQPYTDKTLESLARSGVHSVDVICPGFAVDCLETLEEIAVQNDELFRAAGGKTLHYIPALNDSPIHRDALAALITRHAQGL